MNTLAKSNTRKLHSALMGWNEIENCCRIGTNQKKRGLQKSRQNPGDMNVYEDGQTRTTATMTVCQSTEQTMRKLGKEKGRCSWRWYLKFVRQEPRNQLIVSRFHFAPLLLDFVYTVAHFIAINVCVCVSAWCSSLGRKDDGMQNWRKLIQIWTISLYFDLVFVNSDVHLIWISNWYFLEVCRLVVSIVVIAIFRNPLNFLFVCGCVGVFAFGCCNCYFINWI